MKIISQILVVAIINLTCTYSYSWVDSSATQLAVQKKSISQVFRQQLLDLADRQEVIDQLVVYGVSREEAIRRINSLTDEEIAFFYENMDQLPSGGEESGRSPVLIFFDFIFYSPIWVPAVFGVAIGWVVVKITSPVLCLFYFNKYKNCPEEPLKFLDAPAPKSVKEVFSPSQGASCLEPCYSDFNDCMDSSETSVEESQCEEEKTACSQQCEGNFQ